MKIRAMGRQSLVTSTSPFRQHLYRGDAIEKSTNRGNPVCPEAAGSCSWPGSQVACT